MHFSKDEIEAVFRVVSAVLHLGNLAFEAVEHPDGEAARCVPGGGGGGGGGGYDALEASAAMLGVTGGDLEKALTTRRIKAAGEWFTKQHTAAQSAEVRDALAKDVYHRHVTI